MLIGPAQVAAASSKRVFGSRLHRPAGVDPAGLPDASDGRGHRRAPGGVAASASPSSTAPARILTIARGTLPLAIFGPRNHGYRLGLVGAPARMAQAAAPLAFGLLIDVMGSRILIVSSALSPSAPPALCLAPAAATEHHGERRRPGGRTRPRRAYTPPPTPCLFPSRPIRAIPSTKTRPGLPRRSRLCALGDDVVEAYAAYFVALALVAGLSFYVGTLRPKKPVGLGPRRLPCRGIDARPLRRSGRPQS